LLSAILERYKNVSSIIEIGCGTGIMIKAAKDLGLQAVGYDINEAAIEYGKKNFGADLRAELWDPQKQIEKVDLIFCIMVLEHLENPRPLVFQMAEAAKKYNAKIFVSVPFLNRDRWHFILNPDPKVPNTPFFNNDVHVTHFSRKGMEKLAKEAGATNVTYVGSMVSKDEKGWGGLVFDFSPQPMTSVAKTKVKNQFYSFFKRQFGRLSFN
ncbi:MAG: class I SAM-dependent methyltransferase, partial [Pseudobdellovibrionaceae bacterium]